MSLSPSIRSATAADGEAIRRLVDEARLNPRDLDWRRFLVADEAGVVVACAQVRVHGHGTRELASVVVTPGRQGRGLGRAIAEAMLAAEPTRPIYLFTASWTAAFWERLGFREVRGAAIPRDMRSALRIGRVAVLLYGLVVRRRIRLLVMRRADP